MKVIIPVRRICLAAFAILLVAGSASAIAVRNPEFGYSVDLPVGWTDADSSDPYHIGLMAPGGDAMIQIIALDPTTAPDGAGIAESMLEELNTRAELVPFDYVGRSACLADVSFVTAGNEVRGYMVTIDAFLADYVLIAFSLVDSYVANHDQLLSALDSFALDDAGSLFPGPISAFYGSGDTDNATVELAFGTGTVRAPANRLMLEASQVLVEREARILAPYGSATRDVFEAAWRRYFRMIYRENYQQLLPVSRSIETRLESDGVPRVDYPREVLAWLQGFDYVRTGGLSDFSPPVQCLVSSSGDCDSLALTYVILMHQLGFDAIVMVSDRYSHALAAVDTLGPGARFSFEGREWLVAELTEPVEMGQIAADMADPSGWIGVRMRLRTVENR